MDSKDAATFESTWAVVELFGHAQIAGFVSAVSFGPAQMLKVDVPPLPEREYVTQRPGYVDGSWTEAGATVRRLAKDGRSRLLGVGAIYALNPCTQAVAMMAVERLESPEIKLVSLPKQLQAGSPDDEALLYAAADEELG